MCTLYFGYNAFSTQTQDSFLYFLKTIFENNLELLFILFYFKGKQNKKKKTLNVIHKIEKWV